MKRVAHQFALPAACALAASLLIALALASPAPATSVDSAHTLMLAQAPTTQAPAATRQAPGPATGTKSSKVDAVEARIAELHEKLQITPAQEDLWKNVVQVMRENAKNMQALTQARSEHAKNMTAIDDVKSYSEIVAAHADGIKKFIPAFEPLYASMSDAQKKNADTIFRSHDGSRTASKQSPSKGS